MKFHISLLDILNSEIKLKIIKFLLTHKAFMSEREIASILKISHMSVNRKMQELADINFVNFITVGKAHLWKVNRKSYSFKVISSLIKVISGINEPIEDLKSTILKNLPKTLIEKVILFGSVAKGKEHVNSDIDIFILIKDMKSKKEIESSIYELSKKCFELYGNRLAPYILTNNEMKKKKNSQIISEIDEGIKIFPKKKG